MQNEENKIVYIHQVQYYETDMMQIVHHSNYIRWFEEARTYMLEQIGYPYDRIESEGILIPVLSVSCEYKIPCRYGEKINVIPKVTAYNGIRLKFEYEVWNEDFSELRVKGTSSHCFVNSEFKPVSVKRENPELHELLS